MNRVETILCRGLELLLGVCLGLIAATVVTLVGLRYLWNTSVTGANELIVILFVYTTALGAALGIAKGEHLAIVFLIDKLPPRGRRGVDGIRVALVGLINAIALVYSVRWIAVTGHYLMPSTGLPRWVAQLSIPLGCSLGLLFAGMHLVRLLRRETPGGGKTPDSGNARLD